MEVVLGLLAIAIVAGMELFVMLVALDMQGPHVQRAKNVFMELAIQDL